MKYHETDLGSLNTVFEGINVTATETPQHLILIYDFIGDRIAVEPSELRLPLDSYMQQIADALLKIHENVFGKKGD